MRALLFSLGVAVVLLLLAGCEEVMDKPAPAPMADTAPSFSKTVADQAYLVEEIVSLTLPHATGGDGPLTYSLAPEIPGLMFDATTRTLSGAPTAADAYDMTYQAADADDNTTASDATTLTFTITVQEPEPLDTAPAFAATVADQTYTEGDAISPLTFPEASGGNGALSYSLMPAVPGLMFDATTRTLSGAPTAADAYDMTYQAADADDNTTASDATTLTFTITVQEPEPLDTAPAFAATVADQTYTEGDAISPLTFPEASGGNGALSYSLMPAVPGLMFDATTRTLSGAPTAADAYDMTYQAADADDNTTASDATTLTFTITVQEPEPLDTAPAFAATVADQTYTEGDAISPLTFPEASGGNGALSYSLMPAVPGLMFDATTRTLSGAPTAADAYDMTYQAADADDNTTASDATTLTFTITVQEPEPLDTAPAFAATVADQTYTEGDAISPLTFPEASGGNGALSYSLMPAVPGLMFDATTRTLSGAPTAADAYDMTYQAADADDNTTASDATTLTFTITVQEPEPLDTAPAFAATVADQTYTEGDAISPLTFPEASGGNGALSYSLMPAVPGLMFDATTRTLSGAPTAADAYDMTYQAADADDNTTASDATTLTFTITVQEPEPLDTAPAFAATVADQTYTEGDAISPLTFPEASGGNGALSYSLMPAVPGLMFDATTRTLSGAPTAADAYDMTYQAADADDNTTASDATTLTFTITVQEPEPLDTAPAFAATVADQTYTEGDAISPLTFPEASGGNGALSYSLMPAVPGLMFDATTRTLSGAPTIAGTHAMTYTVVDGDENTAESDAASQRFTITVLAACPTHSATQIVGDYIVDGGSFFPSGWVFSFRADGTFQINSGAVTINGESEGNYSYDVTTCTLAWRGTEPAAEPSIGITIIGHLGFVAIRGTNEHFVDWNGPDLFCERGTADSSVCINTYSRAGTQPEPEPEPEPEPMACVPHPASQILGNWDASGNIARDDEFYTFRANGTYQNTWSSTAPAPGLDRPPVTRTVTVNGTYSYVAETCLLTWEPEIANIPHFVAWNGSDQFSTKFSPGGFVLTTFDRR